MLCYYLLILGKFQKKAKEVNFNMTEEKVESSSDDSVTGKRRVWDQDEIGVSHFSKCIQQFFHKVLIIKDKI